MTLGTIAKILRENRRIAPEHAAFEANVSVDELTAFEDNDEILATSSMFALGDLFGIDLFILWNAKHGPAEDKDDGLRHACVKLHLAWFDIAKPFLDELDQWESENAQSP